MIKADNDPLSDRAIGAAIEVHRYLGPGLLESSHEECRCFELAWRVLCTPGSATDRL